MPRPWQRVTGPEGMAYLRTQARRRLAPLDGLARGLLAQAEEAAARRWVSSGTGACPARARMRDDTM